VVRGVVRGGSHNHRHNTAVESHAFAATPPGKTTAPPHHTPTRALDPPALAPRGQPEPAAAVGEHGLIPSLPPLSPTGATVPRRLARRNLPVKPVFFFFFFFYCHIEHT